MYSVIELRELTCETEEKTHLCQNICCERKLYANNLRLDHIHLVICNYPNTIAPPYASSRIIMPVIYTVWLHCRYIVHTIKYNGMPYTFAIFTIHTTPLVASDYVRFAPVRLALSLAAAFLLMLQQHCSGIARSYVSCNIIPPPKHTVCAFVSFGDG